MKHLQRSFLTLSCAIALIVAGCAGPSSSGISTGKDSETTNSSESTSSEKSTSPASAQSSEDSKASEPEKKSTDTPPAEEKKSEDKPEEKKPSTTSSAQIPEGWKKVTGKKSGISIAVPNDWVALGQDVDEETARKNAESISPTPDATKQASDLRKSADVLYASPSIVGVAESILLVSVGLPESMLNSLDKAKEGYAKNPAFSEEEVKEVDSPVGKIYVASGETNGLRARDFYIPDGKGKVYEVAIIGLDDADVEDRFQKVVASISVE